MIFQTDGQVNPLTVVESIRKDRVSLVQHNNQYELVHHACLEYAERALHEIQYVDTLPDLQPIESSTVHVCPTQSIQGGSSTHQAILEGYQDDVYRDDDEYEEEASDTDGDRRPGNRLMILLIFLFSLL